MRENQVPTARALGNPAFVTASSAVLPPDVTVVPTYKMYSAGQVALATFLGGPMGGAILLGLNYRRLGQPGRLWIALVLATVATGALIAIGVLFPSLPGISLPIGSIFAMSAVAQSLQGDAYAKHIASGGKQASSWRAAGVSILTLVVTFGLMVGVGVAYMLATVSKVDFGHAHEVYYEDGGTEVEAQGVGDALTEIGYFSNEHPATVFVSAHDGRHIVTLVLKDKSLADETVSHKIHGWAERISTKAFGGEAVDIQLEDKYKVVHTQLEWESRPR
jgi:hypothetical protein